MREVVVRLLMVAVVLWTGLIVEEYVVSAVIVLVINFD
jgi:hypothetical protein